MTGYLIGALVGTLLGGVSVFAAFGGVTHRRLFLRLCRRKGKWKRVWLVMVLVSVAVGAYGAWLFGAPSADFFSFALLGCYLLAMAVTDLRGRYIPDDATVAFALVALAFRLTLGPPVAAHLLNGLIGALAGGILLGLPHLLRKDEVGLGDVKLVAAVGLMVGFPSVIYLLMRALLFMALFSVIQLLRKKAALKTQVPLAPFLFLGALI